MTYPKLYLNKDQHRRVLAGHLWIYNNEINTALSPLSTFQPGDLVQVISANQNLLGVGYINPHTLLCTRLLSSKPNEKINVNFFRERLLRALKQRERLYTEPYYRWVFSESDALPGLVIDRFGDVIAIQINTAGMERLKEVILEAVVALIAPKTVIWRNDTPYREIEGLPLYVGLAYGAEVNEHIVRENHCEFIAPLQLGQKTGWFYDHRDNRLKITRYVKDKTVLDLFCYLGAFSIPMAKAGAKHITAVDSSKSAIEYLKQNAVRNQVEQQIEAIATDAFDFLKTAVEKGLRFDVIVMDPPALIKRKKEAPQGLRAYEKINQLALSLLNPGGVLLSASCSMHLSTDDLMDVLRRASLKASQPISIIEQLHQGPDHPVHSAIAETNYLKGFIATI